MKGNWFWGVLLIIIISWLSNIIYFEVHQLEEPVVLDAYIDIPASKNINFSLFYLTNSSEIVELESLIAGSYTYSNEQNFFPWFGDTTAQMYRQQFTHQFLKQASFTIDEQSFEQVAKSVQANDLYARFTNGQVVPVLLEKLNFKTPLNDQNFITSKVSFGSNQGIQGEIFEVTETIQMDALVLPESIKNQVDLKVQIWSDTSTNSLDSNKIIEQNWKDIDAPLYSNVKWPLKLEEGDSVGLIFQVKYDSYIDIIHNWSGITESGKAFTYTSSLLIEPNLSNQDIVDIVQKARSAQR